MATFNNYGAFAVDSGWGTAGNWSAGVPVDGQEVKVLTNSRTIPGTDHSLVQLDVMLAAADFLGALGSIGTPMRIDAAECTLEHGGANLYLDGIIANLYTDFPSLAATACVINSVNAKTVTAWRHRRGRATVGAACTLTAMHIIGEPAPGQSIVQFVAGCTPTLVEQECGKIIWDGNAGTPTVNVDGGELEQNGGTITACTLRGTGKIKHGAGTMTTLTMKGGILDITGPLAHAIGTIEYYDGQILQGSYADSAIAVNVRARGRMGWMPGTSLTLH